MNSSKRLNWKTETAPVLTDYMLRMKNAGYTEKYRAEVLQHAFSIYDKKLEEERETRTRMGAHRGRLMVPYAGWGGGGRGLLHPEGRDTGAWCNR